MFSALRITVPESLELDLAGAWTLREWMKAAEAAGVERGVRGSPFPGSSSSSTPRSPASGTRAAVLVGTRASSR